MSSRKELAKRNIVWGFIYRLISVLGPFVTRSLFISRLGADYLGLNGLFSSVLQMLSLAELGFSSAVVFCMYKPAAEGDTELVGAYLAYFKKIYRNIGLVVLACGIALVPFLDIFVKGTAPSDVNLKTAYLVYLSNTAISYLMYAYKQSILSAYQRNDLISKVNMIASLLMYSAQLLVLIIAPNFYLYILLLPAMTIASNLITACLTDYCFPEYRDSRIKGLYLSKERKAEIRKHVGGLMVNRICSTTRDSMDSIVISTFLGLTSVAQYSNYFCVISSIFSVLSTINSAVGNSIGNSVAVETPDKNYQDLRLFSFMYAMVSGVCTACLVVLFQPFIELWVGDAMLLPFGMAVLFSIYFYARTIGDIRSLYENATGIWWQMKGRMVVEAVLNVALNLLLVNALGLYGVVLGTIVSLVSVNFLYGARLVFNLYFKNGKTLEHYLDHLSYACTAALACSFSFAVTQFVFVDGFVGIALKGFITVLVSALVETAVFARSDRFKNAIHFASGFIGIRGNHD